MYLLGVTQYLRVNEGGGGKTGMGKMGEGGQKLQTFSYKLSKSLYIMMIMVNNHTILHI